MRQFTKYPQIYINAGTDAQNCDYRGFEVKVKDTDYQKTKLAIEIAMACDTVDYEVISGYLCLTGEDVADLDYIKESFDYLGIEYTVKEFNV